MKVFIDIVITYTEIALFSAELAFGVETPGVGSCFFNADILWGCQETNDRVRASDGK